MSYYQGGGRDFDGYGNGRQDYYENRRYDERDIDYGRNEMMDRERERDYRERERDYERERDRENERDREREKERERNRKRDREKKEKRERERKRGIEKHKRRGKYIIQKPKLNIKSTFYIKKMKFEVPETKFDVTPKYYKPVIKGESYYKYFQSMLDSKNKRKLHTGVALNIPFNLVENIENRNTNIPLNSTDRLLIGDRTDKMDDSGDSKKGKGKFRDVSWLRKTEFLKVKTDQQKEQKKKKQKLFDIEQSFIDCKNYKTHNKKKHLTIVKEFDLIPNFDLWKNNFVQIQFFKDSKKNEIELNRPTFKNGFLRKNAMDNNALYYYENEEGEIEDRKYSFKRRYNDEKRSEKSHFIILNEKNNKATYNDLDAQHLLKRNTYKKTSNIGLELVNRTYTEEELKGIRTKMDQVGFGDESENKEKEETKTTDSNSQENNSQNAKEIDKEIDDLF